jgi:hypothetical protein
MTPFGLGAKNFEARWRQLAPCVDEACGAAAAA